MAEHVTPAELSLIYHYTERQLAAMPTTDDRKFVADYLRTVANAVENDQINGFEVSWQMGQEHIDAKLLLKKAPEFISLDFTLSDRPCGSDS